jgi:rod shape-determining protein MreD
MRPGLFQRVDTRLRQALPVMLTFVFVLGSVAPVRLPDYVLIAPGLVLIAVFYWSVHRPDLLRPWHACLLGLLDDMLAGSALGVNALVFTLVHAVVLAQHRFFRGKGFAIVWVAFAGIAPAAILTTTLLSAVAARGGLDPTALVVQILLTIALYPPVAWLLGRAQRLFLAEI